jgi:hypothetical protein
MPPNRAQISSRKVFNQLCELLFFEPPLENKGAEAFVFRSILHFNSRSTNTVNSLIKNKQHTCCKTHLVDPKRETPFTCIRKETAFIKKLVHTNYV